jgi:alpha-ketoglutarate-dependent 2,4-dichlorophenoxyacetate dioxygenase
MTYQVNPLHPIFAAELVGADLTQPPSPELVAMVEDAMARYAVCVVRDASLRDEDHMRFSRAFGPLELPPGASRRSIAPQLYDVTNLDPAGEILPSNDRTLSHAKGFERFHSDSSFNTMPTKWSLLMGHIVPPEGADTDFVDTRAVFDALSEPMKARIAGLEAVHDFWGGRERLGVSDITPEMRRRYPPVTQPMVRTSASGRKALYIGGHAVGIVGWPEDEALALLDELFDFATQDRFVYAHKWRPADLVIWDNRCTLHRATPFERDRYRRDCRRTTINEYGEERTCFAHLETACRDRPAPLDVSPSAPGPPPGW